jgi:hypothetical protein
MTRLREDGTMVLQLNVDADDEQAVQTARVLLDKSVRKYTSAGRAVLRVDTSDPELLDSVCKLAAWAPASPPEPPAPDPPDVPRSPETPPV